MLAPHSPLAAPPKTSRSNGPTPNQTPVAPARSTLPDAHPPSRACRDRPRKDRLARSRQGTRFNFRSSTQPRHVIQASVAPYRRIEPHAQDPRNLIRNRRDCGRRVRPDACRREDHSPLSRDRNRSGKDVRTSNFCIDQADQALKASAHRPQPCRKQNLEAGGVRPLTGDAASSRSINSIKLATLAVRTG